MALLLDTHAVLWWWNDAPYLSTRAREAIAESGDVRVSAASALEVALKYRLGKLLTIGDPAEHWSRLMTDNGFVSVPIDEQVAIAAGLLTHLHGDPFDRVIAAQGLADDLLIVTCDAAMAGFGCRTLW